MENLILFSTELLFFFNEMAIYLVIGLIIAGILHVFFPDELITKHLGQNSFASVLKASLFGIPLPICSCGVIPVATSFRKKGASKGATLSFLISTPQIGTDSFLIVCATSTTPIAAALMLKGLSPGAGLVLLLAGPATNAITISVITKTLGKTVTIIYLATISIVSVGLGFILNLLVVDFSKSGMMNHQHEMLPLWVKIAGSVLLSAMFVIHYMSNLLNRKKIVSAHKSDHKKMIEVFGMTCAHCSESVRKAVDGIDGTSEVNVDLKSGKVIFNFESVDMESLKKAIENKGFEVGKIT